MQAHSLATILILVSLLLLSAIPSESRRRIRYKECPEERLKVREGSADVVLTGTVKRLYGAHADLYGGEVQVKRVVKGDHIQSGETLIVEGFGNKDLCDSQVIAKDSKVFLLSQLQTGRFRLNSSVVQINAANLDKITATVKGTPYRRRPPLTELPCEKKYCKFNADCFDENRRAVCRCPVSCPDQYGPVCASDGFTYNSECQMRADSCRKKKRVYVKHEGMCTRSK